MCLRSRLPSRSNRFHACHRRQVFYGLLFVGTVCEVVFHLVGMWAAKAKATTTMFVWAAAQVSLRCESQVLLLFCP